MQRKTYSVSIVRDLQRSSRRAVAFLRCPADVTIDAKETFESLSKEREREVRNRFDHWIGGGTNDKWFHGWPGDPNDKDGFAFKWKENRRTHRLYGFLSHPDPLNRPRLQVCVLIFHAAKNTEETDKTILKWVNELFQTPEVIKAVVKAFQAEGNL